MAQWREEKTLGPGRDSRVLPIRRDSKSLRFRTLVSAMAEMDEREVDDWPFRGPRVIVELLSAVRSSGEELPSFHEYFLRISGL